MRWCSQCGPCCRGGEGKRRRLPKGVERRWVEDVFVARDGVVEVTEVAISGGGAALGAGKRDGGHDVGAAFGEIKENTQ